jgi:hypothetical protein
MRTTLPCLIALACTTPTFAQVPNGGFESWYSNFNYMEPVGWWTSNAVTFTIDSVASVEQGMPGAVGTSYLKATSRDLGNFGVEIGRATLGDPMLGFPGAPYTQRPTVFSGQWQYHPQGNDVGGMVHMSLTRWNTMEGQREVVGVATTTAVMPITSWQTFNVPITYLSNNYPDTLSVHISASGNAPVGGSEIWVDDLGLVNTQGVAEQSGITGLNVFPSPATDQLSITATERMVDATILDVSGRLVRRFAINGLAATIDVTELPTGAYAAQIRSAEGRVMNVQFVKQ